MNDTSYNSECARINPRLEREIQDRERRIQELLRKAAGVPAGLEDDPGNFDISFEFLDSKIIFENFFWYFAVCL